ncbi:DUF397 domain-containing protein [Actinomadura syzygii]|uniref:DUF397 domain-containing protein n=1 Tax=Actinomadura syzygii TaxID=1427538 RepID=A0A5D0U6K1_9ACTN|nr:DUF397 domain-containing protein [Actinomadura syzygii]TYC13727.1 DUF397 domain-containing protein [Actinomadura syzygii]
MSTPRSSSKNWRKSTYSDSSGGNCVEVAALPLVVGVRDSKDPDGPVLAFGRAAFGELVSGIRGGQYDR